MRQPTYAVRLTATARQHLLEIFDYLQRVSPGSGPKVLASLRGTIRSPERMPPRYAPYRRSARPSRVVRFVVHRPYVIYYRVFQRAKVVEVASIRHGARRPPRRF